MAEMTKFARNIDQVAPISSRSAAGIPLSANFNLNGQMPLDDRQIANSIEERDAIPAIRRYDGMVVYVANGEGLSYQLVGGIENSNWVKYGTSDAGDISGLHDVATSGKFEDLEDIPNMAEVGEVEPEGEFANIWFDTAVDTSDEVIIDQNEGVFVKSESGVYFKILVNESGQLTTERVELDPMLAASVDKVVLRSALNVEFLLGVTEDGHLTTQAL